MWPSCAPAQKERELDFLKSHSHLKLSPSFIYLHSACNEEVNLSPPPNCGSPTTGVLPILFTACIQPLEHRECSVKHGLTEWPLLAVPPLEEPLGK